MHLAVLYSREGPACVKVAIPSFTSASVWADAEDDLALFAAELSRVVNKALVIREEKGEEKGDIVDYGYL
jgi:hypothetical protein